MKEIGAQRSTLMHAIIELQEEERRRIALDLHEGLAQTLSTVKMNLSACETSVCEVGEGQKSLFHTSVALLDTALRELSLISYNLMPNTLYTFGLVAALEDMFHMINRVSTIRLAFHTHEYRRLNRQTEIILYRIIQELTNNAHRHSGASEINVQLIMHHKKLVIIVDDDGNGFEVESTLTGEQAGLGLKSAEARVKFLNGFISVDSQTGSGTVVSVEIPLATSAFADEV
jgi:signal transduction histidine kinase